MVRHAGRAAAPTGHVSEKGEMDARDPRWGRLAASAALSVLLSVWANAAGAAERVALVIGNSAYEHTDPLRNPGNDAAGMAAALGRLGFEVVRGTDLDLGGFYDKIREFDAASRGADVTLFFYAGHGLQVQGKNWLAPVDAKLGSRLDLERGAVRLDTVLEHMRGSKRLVYLDACRNNPLAGDLARTMGLSRTAATSRGLARVRSGSGTLIGYATAPDDVAADGDGRNSPFTEALLAHIETPGLSVNDMFGEVSGAVSRATGGEQVPWSHSSLGRFYLASAPLPPKDTGTTAGGTPAPSGDAARAFEAAERLNTVAAYRAFIRRFPGSYEAELAQGHIDKLEWKPQPIDDATPVTPPPPTPSPEAVERRLGLSREESRQVQMGLAAAGHDPGPADGWIGAGSREAIRRWQEAQGKPATGYLDADGAKALLAAGRREAERLQKRARKPGDTFRDCPGCPEMVVVPAGRFEMGSTSGYDDERPVHEVTIARPFAVGVYEVTFAEWDACVSDRGCGGHRPGDDGWGRGKRPVMNVSWNDAQAYVRWLSEKTGEAYRLLSEAEWEYVARAGTTTKYWWGNDIGRSRANCRGCGSRWDGRQTAPVGSFPANPFGLHDVHGNVWEWVEDCWNGSYDGAPTDGSAWKSGDCDDRRLRGGSWNDLPRDLRSAYRDGLTSGGRVVIFGFRVARSLTP